MRLVLLVFVCLVFGIQRSADAQCTTGCTNTITLSSSSQTISYTFSGSNETLCIVKSGSVSGNATIASGTINVSNLPNATICYGPGVVVASGVNVNNPNSQFTINNYGTVQNSLNLNQGQHVVNNYGTITGGVSISNGSINNMSGGTFSSSTFTFNGGTFVNNTGSAFNIPGNFTAGSGSNFSGGGSFTVGGNFQTNNGSTVNVGGTANITGTTQTNSPVTFGSGFTAANNVQTNNSGAITFNGPVSITGTLQSNATISFASTANITGNVSVNNGGPITFSGAATLGGTLQTNAATSFGSTLNLTGALSVNNGGPLTVTGAATIGGNVQTNATTNFGSSVSMGGTLQVNNGGRLTVGGSVNIAGSTQINDVTSFGGLANLGGGLTMNNGGNTTFTGGATITGNYTNNATANFNGSLTVSGTITNNSGGTITSGSGSCKTLCASSITNTGTLSSTSGPNLNVCTTPTGGTQTNVTINSNPTTAVTGFTAPVTAGIVNGSFTHASPLPGGYLVLRKANSSFTGADLPISNTTYTVGATIGGATVIAILNNSTNTYSNAPGCGTFYYAVVSASNNSGTCGSYYTLAYASVGPIVISTTTGIAYTGSPWCTSAVVQNVTRVGVAGGTYSSTAGLTINGSTGAITPSTSTPGTYIVSYAYAASGSCSAGTATASVTINPTPAITAMTTNVCSTTGFSATPVNVTNGNVPAGTTYSWSAPSVAGITGTSSGSGASSITGTLTNTTNAAINVVYSVTPRTVTCVGAAFNLTVTVNPVPVMTNATTTSVCSETALSFGLTSGAAATYSWIATDNTNTTGESLTAQSGATINNTITNNTTTAQSVVYTVTPTGTAGSCIGSSQTVTVTVNPVPVMTNATSTSVCSGTALNFGLTSGATATYSWIAADNTNTTGESLTAQSGATINNTITNNTTTPQTVVYTVTPTGTAGSCVGSSQTVTVTVNPRPVMTSATSTSVCSGTAVSFGLTSGASATYSWIAANNANTTGESLTAQSGATINNTITNNVTTPQNVVYTVTPTGTAGSCVGSPQTVTITVNPVPVMTSATSTSVCSGTALGFGLTSGATAAYSWIATDNVNTTGESTAAQTGATLNNTITNNTTTAQSVVYAVTPTGTAGSCVGATQTVTVTVNPRPEMTSTTSTSVCSGTALSFGLTSGATATYSWIAANNANTTGESLTAQTGATINNTINNTTNSAQNVVYTVTPTGTAGSCIGLPQIVTVTVNPRPALTAMTAAICTGDAFSVTPVNTTNGIVPAGITYAWSAPVVAGITGTAAGSGATSISGTLSNSTLAPINVVYSVTPTAGSCVGSSFNVTVTVNPYPVVAAITGPQTTCVGININMANATAGGVWSSSDDAIVIVDGAGLVTGMGSGTTNINYGVTVNGCLTTVTRAVTVYPGAMGTPNTFGNGFWNAYVYNNMDYSTSYSGFYTTGSALNYNTTTHFTNIQAPSLAAGYQGCQIGNTLYSIRYQRSGFPLGVYRIGIDINDDPMDIILNGTIVYSSGYSNAIRPNVWTGTLGANSNLEIRYANNAGAGEISWNFTLVSPTASAGGTISGNQAACNNANPVLGLTSLFAPVQGSCSLVPNPIQWQSSTDNSTFTDIPAANALSYTIPGALSQTTYYRRAYWTYCDTVYSNTVTVTIYNGPQGTPGVFGNGLWNAYVYINMDYSTNYSGFYTTGSGLTYNSTTDFGASVSPSLAPTYQGCQIGNTQYSIRYQRTGFPLGVYQIGFDINDDNADILLNGNIVYSSPGYNNAVRSNVWTGTLGPNSNLEIRYLNNNGPGQISWNFTLLSTPTASNGGTVAGNQVACSNATPIYGLTSVSAPTQGTCTLVPLPIQWQSSTNNVTFTNIPAANSLTYTIPGALSQTTYYRRAYRTYCDTVFSNTITVSVYSGPVGTPGVFGNGFWNAYVYNAMDFTSNHAGFYTTGTGLNYNTTTDFGNTQAPSLAPTYQGCMINPILYSIRYQRRNFPAGVYQIGFDINDDDADIILNGTTVYSSGGYNPNPRANVWTGTLNANSNLEIRYLNNLGPGQISWNFTSVPTPTSSIGGTISGTQATCLTFRPSFVLTNLTLPTQGTCTAVPNPVQWQSSIDNINFTNITGANLNNYTIPGVLAQTTYFRRAYRTYCDTAYSNTVTVSVYGGPQGTPGVFGNGVWNAYVYSQTDYATGYTGFFTTSSALSQSSTNDFGTTQPPSAAVTYQGCQMLPTLYSVRYQRTNFSAGTYTIDLGPNDDDLAIILNGTTVYSSGLSGANRTAVWTGTLNASSQLEVRFNNTGAGPAYMSFTMTMISNSPLPIAGTIAGNQSTCSTVTPIVGLTSVSAPTQGICSLVPVPIQWQSSTNNVTFTNIAGANAVAYTIPSTLAQTTYFRRAYRTYCDTVYSNTITVSVYNGAQGTPNTFGNGLWNAFVYNANDYTSNYSGFYTTAAALTYNTATDFTAGQAPSFAPNYQGCHVNANVYSVRYQRTNFPIGVYQIGLNRNDDDVDIILNGLTVYSSGTNTGVRANVWTGTLGANSNLEIRYRNLTGPGDINWTFTLLSSPSFSSAGTVSGNQTTCSSVLPIVGLTSVTAPSAGGCTLNAIPVQWQSSTNNVTFTNIAGANANAYTIPAPLSQTTYFRRAYRTFCDTVFSNTVTVTVYNGAQGTPGTFGNGIWNAYVYNSTDYSSNYSGFYTTASGTTYNSTTDFANNAAPSVAPTYQGCQVSANGYSIRYQRTGFTPAIYRIALARNDDDMDIILNGETVYSSGTSTTARANVWTGTLNASSNLEIRYRNTGGSGEISWSFSTVTNSPVTTPGTISGAQAVCNFILSSATAPTQGNCTLVPNPIQWQSSPNNVTFTDIAGANGASYTIPGPLVATTYFRRAYRTFCDTVFSNSISATNTLVNGAQGTPGTFGNGRWNAYVYNANDYVTNYSGFFTTPAALNYNSTSSYNANQAPSTASTYLGCPVSNTVYSVRFQRTNFTPGVYQIGINRNDDDMDIILNGVTVYTSVGSTTARTNVWTGTLKANSNLEIRYRNTGSNGDIRWTFTSVPTPTNSTAGTIAGNQSACSGLTPSFGLTSISAPTQGTCTLVTNPIQWQSSTNNVTFSNISGANAATYTIAGPLTQTTYFRRAYRTFCDTVFSNTITVSVYNGAQGTPGTFGNGRWNAFVYNANDFTSNYSGFYTTAAGLTYNSTTDFANNQAPSQASTYQGCQVNANIYSVRYQRTNFTAGVYQIGVNRNDDDMDIILNGVTVYSSAGNGGARTNVWTGTLKANSNLEIRYRNVANTGDINWTITAVSTPTASTAGTIAGNQTTCTGVTPLFGLTSVSAPVQGTCTLVTNPIQWQSSTNNVTFTNIPAANALTYTIPGALTQTTYFRRAYITFCDTVFSNTVTVSVYNGAQGTPGVFGNGLWNVYVYNTNDYATNYSGFYTTAASLSYNTTSDFGVGSPASTAPTYQGCHVSQNTQSLRMQRTNFTPGTYQIDMINNDDGMNIILNGTTIYTSGGYDVSVRTNVWTGTLNASSQLEFRVNNSGGGQFQMAFNISSVTNSVMPVGGTIAGNQVACFGSVPTFPLSSSAAGTVGTCFALTSPYQWESSTNNITFTAIPGATTLAYTVPAALSQTTYFRRAYRTYCETVYSNTVTVTMYNGAQGTPGVFGNGVWNAYVYNESDYATGYSGYFTTSTALSQNTTNDFGTTASPSTAPTYQGCQIPQLLYSIRYQRTNFTPGVYRIDLGANDDAMAIILNGVSIYTSGINGSVRNGVWTGTLNASSQLEVRFNNTGAGPGYMSFFLTPVTNSPSNGGTISGSQSACNNATPQVGLTSVSAPTQGTCTLIPTPIQWQSSTNNVTFANIPGANSLNYTIPTILSQTTYYRRAYRTYCDTVYSNTLTVSIFNGPQGTPNTFGNGLWNAYVYNSMDYSSNYAGFYTTASPLTYNSTTDFGATQAPSQALTFQGCMINPILYSIRYQRTNFPEGVYQIGFDINDDNADIILDGVVVYSFAGYNPNPRANVWTGTLKPTSRLEIRYLNNLGPGQISWNFSLISSPIAATPGVISGSQVACNTTVPSFGLTSVSAPVQGSCTLLPNAIQWQSSTNNVTFTNIPGGNLVNYTIPAILSQTTYFRRAYRTYCDTLYSNTITVTIYNGAQGTPNTFGNGRWNAYVYNANDYTNNYSGFYTTAAGLTYNSTTDFTATQAPSQSPTYQGCQVNANVYSVRYQRTNFPLGVYQIGVNRNDEDMNIILNGVVVYSSVGNGTARANVWTGTLGANSNLEIRYRNLSGSGDINWTFTLLTLPTYSAAGTISGNQAVCSNVTPTAVVSSTAATQGSCSLNPIPYQWESSTNNITFTSIAGANATSYTLPGPLAQTTYFRRAYRTYCDTIYSNVITKTVTSLPTASISYSGAPFCSSLSTPQLVSLTGTSGGTFSSAAGLVISSSAGAITPSTSTAGTYTVTYVVAAAGGCASVMTTRSVTITSSPTVTISYSGSPFCTSNAAAQAVSRIGAAGGSYSSTTGLSINPSTGAITPSTSTAGTYTVTYSIPASGGCGIITTTTNVAINALPTASISYSGSSICKSIGGSYPVTLIGTSGGNFSTTAGLSLNTSSGDLNLTASSNGTYIVTYTIAAAAGCPLVSTNTSVTLSPDVSAPTTPSGTSTFCQGSTIGFTTSATNATGYSWSVTGAGNNVTGSGTSVSAVFDPAFSGAATISVSALGCGGPTAPVSRSLTINPTGMWLGSNSNWNAAANWCGGVPTVTTNVMVPTGATNMPQVNGSSFCNNITLQAGTTLLVNGSNNLTIAGSFINAGTFTPATGSTVTYSSSNPQTVVPANYGNLSTSGTGLKTLSGNIQISGTFSPGASSHDAGSSTVVFNGSSAQNIPAFTFYNLSSSTNTVKSLTANVTVSNQLALTNGTVSIGANSLQLGGTVSGTGTLRGTCSSSLVLNGSGSTGTLRFATGGNTLGTLAMSKSAAGDVTLGGDLDICSVLNLSQGKVILGKNNLTLLSGAVSSNQNATSYVQTIDQNDTTGAGFFIREVASGGGMTIFPVGNASTYTPASLDNIGFTRNFKVRVFSDIYEHGTYGDPVINLDNSVQKTWEIAPTAGSGAPDVSIKLQWNLSDEGTSFPATRLANKLYMGKNVGVGNSLWTKLVTDESDLTGEPFSITTARVTTFSKFAVGADEQPLPVRMGNLMVEKGVKSSQLSWKTYSERDSKGFEIMKSTNGSDFTSIGFVKAAGNSNDVIAYTFEDRSENRKVYYKIRFVGTTEGDVAYSNVVVVNPGAQPDMQAWPNPTMYQMTVSFSGMTETDVEGVELALTSVEGKMIPTPEFRTESGQIIIQTSGIPSGIYLLEARKDGISLGKIRVTKL